MRYQQGKLLELKKEFEQKGISDGSRQIPQLEAEVDYNEQELRLTGNEALRPIELYHSKLIQEKRDDLAKMQTNWTEQQSKNLIKKNIEDELTSLKNSLESKYRDYKNQLEDVGTRVIVSNSELNTFRVINKISRQARYPISHKKAFAIMCAIVVGESIINAYAHQGEGGLIDGAGIAFVISAINVVIAAFLGRWFTNKNHISSNLKILGWCSFALFLISSVYLNSLYATFRTELHKILEEDSIVTEVNSQTNPVTDKSIEKRNAVDEIDEIGPKSSPTKVAFLLALKKAWRVFIFEVPFRDLLSYLTFFLTIIFSVIAFYE